MPAQFDAHCPSCGKRHEFVYREGDMTTIGKSYEYKCPMTRELVRVATDEWSQVTHLPPADAVIVREVD